MRPNAWIKLLAYEGRIRHVADRRMEAGCDERLASIRSRVVADLRLAIASDIEGFLNGGGNGAAPTVTCHNGQSAHGFVVTRTDDHVVTHTLDVDLTAGTLGCRYLVGGRTGRPSDEPTLAIEIGNNGAALSLWNEGVDRPFATVDALSAFLLAPMLGAG